MKTLLLSILALGLAVGAFAQGQMAQLGVATRPADKAVTDVLGLPEGFGLIVEGVVDGSAADTSGIRQHDLLHKFDGQLLTSPRQLALLVRSKQPKDKVDIDYLRKGKATTTEVQLGATERTELAPENALGFNIEPPQFEMFFDRKNMKDLEAEMAAARERFEKQMGNLGGRLDNAARDMELQMQQMFNNGELEKALGDMEKELGNLFQGQGQGGGIEQALGQALGQAFGQLGGQMENGAQGFAFGNGNASVKQSVVENGMKYTFSQDNDKKTFQVQDVNADKMLFDGPVNTDNERAKVPADHMAKLQKMEKNVNVGGNAGVFKFNIGPGGMMFGGNGFPGMGRQGQPGRNNRNGAAAAGGNNDAAAPKVQEGVISIIDDELTVSISERDGQKHCRAVDPDGKVLFDGPIVTKQDQDKLPAEVRDVLEDLNALPAPSAPAAPKKPAIEEDEEL